MCGFIDPWAAVVCGSIAGAVYIFTSMLMVSGAVMSAATVNQLVCWRCTAANGTVLLFCWEFSHGMGDGGYWIILTVLIAMAPALLPCSRHFADCIGLHCNIAM